MDALFMLAKQAVAEMPEVGRCRRCTGRLRVDATTLLHRVGGSVPLLAVLAEATSPDDDAQEIARLIRALRSSTGEHGPPGRLAVAPARLRSVVLTRDLDRDLVLVSRGEPEAVDEVSTEQLEDYRAWLAHTAVQFGVLDLFGTVAEYLDTDDTDSFLRTHPALLEPANAAFVAKIIDRIVELVPAAAHEQVRTRHAIVERSRVIGVDAATAERARRDEAVRSNRPDADRMAALVRLTEAHLSPVDTVVELDRFLATVTDLPVLGALVTVEVFQNFQGPRLRALPPDVDIAARLRSARDLAAQALGPDAPDTLACMLALGYAELARASADTAAGERARDAFLEVLRRAPAGSRQELSARVGYAASLTRTLPDQVAAGEAQVIELERCLSLTQSLGQVGTPDAAAVLNNLAVAYRNRVSATQIDDLRRALGYLNLAATDGVPPPDLAPLLMSLGNVLQSLYELGAADVDDVIAAYDRCATHVDGSTFDDLDRAQLTVNRSAAHLSHALREDSAAELAQAVALGEAAFDHLSAVLEPTDPRRLAAGANLLVGLSARDDRRADELAASLLADTAARPQERYTVALNVGNRMADRGDWDAASRWFDLAVDAQEHLREAVELETRRLNVIARSSSLHVAAAFAAARSSGQEGPARAVAMLERGRATGLAARLRQDLLIRAAAASPDPSIVDLGSALMTARGSAAEAAARFDRLPDGPVRQAAGDEVTTLTRQATALSAQLSALLSTADPATVPADTPFPAIRTLSSPDIPLAYALLTRWGGLLILVVPDGDPEVTDCRFTSTELATTTGGTVPDGLPDAAVLRIIGDRLAAPLADRLHQVGATGVRLVPVGILAGLPWHACPVNGPNETGVAPTLGDSFDIAYLPSAATALLRSRQRSEPYRYTLLGGPDGPALSDAEDAICAADYPHPSARADTFPPAVHRVPQVLHISCHAELRQDSPLASVFHLDGGDWELADLRESGLLAGTSLVVAAACETGRTVSRVRDEVIGLATGLIECGARLVIASLWPVDDRATFLLVTEFYRQLGRLDPEWADPAAHAPAALRAATRWLRCATLGEIRTRARMPEGRTGTAAVTAIINWPGPDEFRAFAHPYYWAGFIALDASDGSERSRDDRTAATTSR